MGNEMNLDYQAFFNFTSNIDESFIVYYYNNMRGLIANKYNDIKKEIETEIDPEKLSNLKELKNLLQHYTKLLTNNVFLMNYSFGEEWIFLKISNTSFKELISSSGSITRFKEPLKRIGIELCNRNWCIIAEAELIRNCLMHANGRIDLVSNNKIYKLVTQKKYSSYFIIDCNRRLYITPEYLNFFRNAIKDILHHRIQKVGQADDVTCEHKDELIKLVKEKPITSILIASGIVYVVSKLFSK